MGRGNSWDGRSLIVASWTRIGSASRYCRWDGRRIDIESLSKQCRESGTLLAVDGIQAVGAIPVDVKTWDCDFLACGGQKWLFGPVGTGFCLYKKKEDRRTLRPGDRLGQLPDPARF